MIRPYKEVKDEAVQKVTVEWLDKVLTKAEGNVAEAARLAKMDRGNLHRLARQFGVDPTKYRPEEKQWWE